MARIKCEVDGEKFSKYMNEGTLENPDMVIECDSRVEPFEGSENLAVVYPLEDTDVVWHDAHGGRHAEHLFAGKGVIIDKKFLDDGDERERVRERARGFDRDER